MQQQLPGTDSSLHAWLEILDGQPVPIQTSTQGHILGDFYTESVGLCYNVIRTVIEAAEDALARDYSSSTRISKMFRLMDGKAYFGVAIFSSTPPAEDFLLIAKDVLSRVSQKEHYLAPNDDSPCHKHVDQFLARHGGKILPETLIARMQSDWIELRGKFPHLAERPQTMPEPIEVIGKIDGLTKKRRMLFVDLGKNKSTSCKFDEEVFLWSLVEALRESTAYRIKIAFENDGTGKPEPILKDLQPLNEGWSF